MIEIRFFTEHDIDDLVSVDKQCFTTPWHKEGFAFELTNPQAVFLVALLDDQTIGYAGMHVSDADAYILNVAVLPAFQNQGIGRVLLQKLIDEAKNRLCHVISLEVRKSNQHAIHLYKSFKFECIGKRNNFYSFPREDAYIFVKQLKEDDE